MNNCHTDVAVTATETTSLNPDMSGEERARAYALLRSQNAPAMLKELAQEKVSAPPEGTQGPSDPWPDPEPLPTGLPPVQPFRQDLLPTNFRGYILDIAERMQCPPDYPAVALIVAVATVVGRQVAMRPKAKDDWTIVPNLWGCVIGRPSLLKTPAIAEPIRMIERLETRARAEFEQSELDHAADELVRKARASTANKAIKAAVTRGDDAQAHQAARDALAASDLPVRRRYLTHDSTAEKLGELLRDNPRGILVYRDELIGFLRTLDQEGREGSRAFYLEAWNGTGGFRFDRIGRGTVELDATCVSIIGAIQPGPLGEYMIAAIRGGLGDDGLVQRFQLAVWPDAPGTWRNVDRWPDTAARRAVAEVFERLDSIDPTAIGAEQESDAHLPCLRFAPEAQAEFNLWWSGLEQRLRGDDLHPALESHLAKFRSLIPSLALLFHLVDTPAGGPVSLGALSRAVSWSKYLETHARRVYAPALAYEFSAAIELSRRLPTLPNPFTARDVYRKGWRLLDTKGTEEALAVLCDFGHIRREESAPAGAGRKTQVYAINPVLCGVAT